MEMVPCSKCDALYFADLETAKKIEPALKRVLSYGVTKNGGIVAKLDWQYAIDKHTTWPVLPLWVHNTTYSTPTAWCEIYNRGRQATNRGNPDDHKLNYRVVYCDRRQDKIVSETLCQPQFKTLDEVQAFLENGKPKEPKYDHRKTLTLLRELCDMLQEELDIPVRCPICNGLTEDGAFCGVMDKRCRCKYMKAEEMRAHDPIYCTKCGKPIIPDLLCADVPANVCMCSREEPHSEWYARRVDRSCR